MVIPANIADEVADEATEMTHFENFVIEKVKAGQSIIGLYPPTIARTREEFEDWNSK